MTRLGGVDFSSGMDMSCVCGFGGGEAMGSGGEAQDASDEEPDRDLLTTLSRVD
ncbi:predicted protein [Pyrenophora tritici-repentis Pt-1C-BFP]|uniref:Uncharacterized protein n=1 Tax=Pyrenophora tritici-repentis (strain Pt-1C-BFP) TaxID=426418 RepID=B2W7K8_PYRTR|nr:uncharacterized protein PTRG_05796 [Pyrenophora tritici-repentis Pt-1C-BFP]EDU48716.1 predicted protein [Pyrenophora tritici-repentis Pt-1C-BFP]